MNQATASMSSSTINNGDNFTTEDHELGSRVVTYAYRAFTWSLSLAAAWSCSGFMLTIIIAIALALLCYVLEQIMEFSINLWCSDAQIAAIGTHARNAWDTVTGWLSTEAKVAA